MQASRSGGHGVALPSGAYEVSEASQRIPRAHLSSASETSRVRIRRLSLLIRVVDLVVILLALLSAELLRFGTLSSLTGESRDDVGFSYLWVTIVIAVAWPALLQLAGAYDTRFLGLGPQEYTAVAKGTLWMFGGLAVASYALNVPLSRGYVLVALPMGLLFLVAARWVVRTYMARLRQKDALLLDVLVVGEVGRVNRLIQTFDKVKTAGFRVVGACTSDRGAIHGGVPVVGSEADAATVAQQLGVDAVAITSSSVLSSVAARRLAWALEGTGIDLMVVPGIHDVAAPRLLTRPVDGVMLMYVDPPTFHGWKRVAKKAMDVTLSGLALAVLAIPMVIVGLLIRAGDGGPAFFTQLRVGREGRTFVMYKFRTMVSNAEELRAELEKQVENDATEPNRGPLFKMKNDPRVTKIGRLLRKTSLDELPQLINIFKGEMSIVGPRPPLPSEVEAYDADAMRRLLVKPGLTGLWQVSGRSNLTWEESIRHDLYYVENWSVMGDLIIMFRTVRAVVTSAGAY